MVPRARKEVLLNKFKSVMNSLDGQNKNSLAWLYVDRQIYFSSIKSSDQPVEDEKIYYYQGLKFRFNGTGIGYKENLMLLAGIPDDLILDGLEQNRGFTAQALKCILRDERKIACEDFLLQTISPKVNALSENYQNAHKGNREKPSFWMQTVSNIIQRRNGCVYRKEENTFWVRISFQFPLINGVHINGKAALKGVKEILETIIACVKSLDYDALRQQVAVYQKQLEIRKYIKQQGLIAFVADGSILPRHGDGEGPLPGAVPFLAPPSLQVTVPFSDGSSISGMGISAGITVITGGGYSGKSTLLDCLEEGIYNHRPGDGREYVIADGSACKIYAEDGRPVQNMDISPFFKHMQGKKDIHCFQTEKASGSVSQAANIIEAVYAGSRLLLIDEDNSATNFMIRDAWMRRLIEKEPIIPFTDRVKELSQMGVSTVLVVGGSGEYLSLADRILLMDEYRIFDRTEAAAKMISGQNRDVLEAAAWTKERYLAPVTLKESIFLNSSCVTIEDARYLKLGELTSNITRLTAIKTDGQIMTLTLLLKKLIAEEGREDEDLFLRCKELTGQISEIVSDAFLTGKNPFELWMEEVRPMDLFFAVSRMRGICLY